MQMTTDYSIGQNSPMWFVVETQRRKENGVYYGSRYLYADGTWHNCCSGYPTRSGEGYFWTREAAQAALDKFLGEDVKAQALIGEELSQLISE